jgi:pyruvate/2-oxoglutarate dehydrogenase complex dihydrolipoamide acyltransferase (E2) component
MTTVTMPQLGESVTEGTIIAWLKQPGEPVALDDSLCEIETEKVTAELPSPFEGTMGEIPSTRETADAGTPLCTVLEVAQAGRRPQMDTRRQCRPPERGPMAIPPDVPVEFIGVAPPGGKTGHSGGNTKTHSRSGCIASRHAPRAEHSLDLARLRLDRRTGDAADVEAAISTPHHSTCRSAADFPHQALPAQKRSGLCNRAALGHASHHC